MKIGLPRRPGEAVVASILLLRVKTDQRNGIRIRRHLRALREINAEPVNRAHRRVRNSDSRLGATAVAIVAHELDLCVTPIGVRSRMTDASGRSPTPAL